MPQSNRGFSKSKMNKDFDERIVPEGEYRDALNIQVSTSEDSDVGSAQTLLGNTLISSGLVPTGSNCVGSIAYGKEDKVYYFVVGPQYNINDQFKTGSWKDYIIEYDIKTKIFRYVFVDIYRVHYQTIAANADRTMPVANVNPLTSNARQGMFINGFDPSNGNQIIFTDLSQTTEVTQASSAGIQIYSAAVDYDVPGSVPVGTILQCTQKRVLNFIYGNIITGLNIIDDLLFWTDNYSEPKKINIKRSIAGTGGAIEVPPVGQLFTGDNADFHTRLCITPDEHNGLRVTRRSATKAWFAEEENVTVIRKNPRTPPTLEMSQHEDGRLSDTFSTVTGGIIGDPTLAVGEESLMVPGSIPTDPFEAKKVGDPLGDIILDNPVDWKVGDMIIFNQQQNDNDTLSFSAEGFTEHDVRATIVAPVPATPSTGPWHMLIESIDKEAIDAEQKVWNLRLEEKKPMFEFKFVRFAYRYKYEDGEYSTISPWSEIAFIPGEYDFLPKKGYNIGMTNRLRQLKIKNYVTETTERPADVVEIDLLYKDESSPNIYTVETIKMTDGWNASGELLWPDTLNGPNILATSSSRGEYEVKSELIHKAVPESQSLRHWDNVPRLALAQSISANRLVYGNYVQNFNLLNSLCTDYDREIKPLINVSLRAFDAPLNAPEGTPIAPLNGLDTAAGYATPGKTVRSLRTYQVGVVYGDRYGRETPVLAGHGGTGSITIEKPNSSTLNKLTVDIATPSPDFAYYYKLFIKETTNEYYNLTMDRWYDAEDGNIWLSFASSDRNKVDIETSIILKKKHNSQEAVTDPARYKILAIENEAPDFIKTNIKSLGILTNNAGNNHIGTSANGFPAPDNDKIWINQNIQGYSNMFEGLNIGGVGVAIPEITRLRNNGTLYIRIKSNISNISSDWYQVSQYTYGASKHKFKTDKVFGDDMAFTSASGDISGIVGGLQVELAEFKVENLKEFEGRFFVKIYKDLVLQNNLLVTPDPQVRVRLAMQIGYWNIMEKKTPNFGNFANWESVGVNLWNEMNGNNNGIPDDFCDVGNHKRRTLFFKSARGQWVTGPLNTCVSPLCCSANRAVREWTSRSYHRWHIDNMYVRGTRDGWCCGSCGNICSCCDRDCMSACSGNGTCNMGKGIHSGSPATQDFNGHSMDLGFIHQGEGYDWPTTDGQFYQIILTPGTLFRWREDPDGLIYRVTGGDNAEDFGNTAAGQHHTWHDKSDEAKGNNKRRIRVHFERLGQPGVGFGTGDAGYHPIGGKDYTAIAGRAEMGFWGGALMLKNKRLNVDGNPVDCGSYEVPSPPGYGAIINGTFAKGFDCGDVFTSTELYSDDSISPGAVTGQPIQVTKREQLCRYRKHMEQFHHLEIVEPIQQDESDWSTDQPAVWETEPKEDSGLDIYWEASPALPIVVDSSTNEMFAPLGSFVVNMFGQSGSVEFPAGNRVIAWSDNSVQVSDPIDLGFVTGSRVGFMRPDGTVVYAITNETGITNVFTIRFADECPAADNHYSDAPHNQPIDLGWSNAYAFGNGIESDRIRDDFNAATINNGVKASSTLAEQYKEERRQTGLIHSGIYNSITGKNDLNQFLTAEKITKDMNPEYGSIQKLHTRDGDIVCMHEDKIMKVLANKDALFNADGSSNVALSKNFLGSDRPFATKYGISTNPESFATDLYGRIYFADRARGSVLRLSGDGITNISDYGMKDWFNDHLNPQTTFVLGSFDSKKNLYNISIEGYTAPGISDDPKDDYEEPVVSGCGCLEDDNEPDVGNTLIGIKRSSVVPQTHGLRKNNHYDSIITLPSNAMRRDEGDDGEDKPPADKFDGWEFFQTTVSFSEKSKGWVTFKSFFPESALSINNEYYTWSNGDMYHHHSNSFRNNFYGIQYMSTIDLLFNDAPETVKSFTTLNYEGTQSRITAHVNPGGFDDGEYYNLTGKSGWYVEQAITDLQSSGELEFKNKEGKYFSYLKGVSTTLSNLDEREFSVQGIGVLGETTWDDDDKEPRDPEPLRPFCLNIIPEPVCGEVSGCTDINAQNYDPDATVDDGSCTYPVVSGCTNPLAFNYDPTATVDDGSCCLIRGCTDNTATNWNPYACSDDGSCLYGCQNTYETVNEVLVDPTGSNLDGSIYFEWQAPWYAPDVYTHTTTSSSTGLLYPANITHLGGDWYSYEANFLPPDTFEINITETNGQCSFTEFITLLTSGTPITCGGAPALVMHDATAEGWYNAPYNCPVGKEATLMASDFAFGKQNDDCLALTYYVLSSSGLHYTNDGFRINVIWGQRYPVNWLEAVHKEAIGNGHTGVTWTPITPNLGCSPSIMGITNSSFSNKKYDTFIDLVTALNSLEDNSGNLILDGTDQIDPTTANFFDVKAKINTMLLNVGPNCVSTTSTFIVSTDPKC